MPAAPAGVLQRLLETEKRIPDPGNAGTIAVDRDLGVVALTTTTSETRTMADPADAGIRCVLAMEVDGGDCVVTFSSAYDETGGTTITFNDTGDFVSLVSVPQGLRTYVWRVDGYDGVTGPTTILGSGNFAGTLAVTGASTLTGGIAGGIPRNVGTWQPVAATSGTDTACSNGTAYVGSVFVPENCTVTGIQYLIGSVGGTDKVIASLHDKNGTLLANSALAGATVGTAATLQQVAFTSTYAAVGPAYYFIALTFNGTTAKFRSVPAYCNAGNGVIGNGVTQTFGTAATFTAPTTFTADKVPVASLY